MSELQIPAVTEFIEQCKWKEQVDRILKEVLMTLIKVKKFWKTG
jgi:hypothetical protein